MSCTTFIARKWPQPIAPGGAERFAVDFTDKLERRWQQGDVSLGTKIRVGGYDAEATTAGRTGDSEPAWPAVLGEEVPDGSVTWTIIAPSTASLLTSVASVDWTKPTGITDSNQVDGIVASAQLAVGASVEVGDYTVTVKATCVNGDVLIQPCILQVR